MMTLPRQTPPQGTVVPTKDLRGGQTRKRSQEAIRQLQKATQHEKVADMADWDGDTHTVIIERGDARRAREEAEPLLERLGETGESSRARVKSRFWIADRRA